MNDSNVNSIRFVFVLLLSLSLSSTHCLGEGGVGVAIAKGLGDVIPLIVRAFGNVEVTAVPVGYKYIQKTTYRGVAGLNSYELSLDASGNPKYTRISEMTGVENPTTTKSADPFTISMGGLPGDVPFAIRKHKCETPLQDGSIFLVTTDSKVTYKVYHKYTVNPVKMDSTTTASFNFTNWYKERADCNEVTGLIPVLTFKWPIANNGITWVTFSPGPVINISHGEGSGNGVTW